MAISNLQTRVITGVIFGTVLMGGILLSEYGLTAITLFVLLVGCYEYDKMLRVLGIETNRIFLYTGNLLVWGGCIYFPLSNVELGISAKDILLFTTVALSLVLFLFTTELFRAKIKPAENLGASILSLFYLGLPCGLIFATSIANDGSYDPWRVLFLFFFMWASDTGAYFAGRFLGKHKLFERLSPKKTIEGFIGGVLTAVAVGVAAHHFFGGESLFVWMCIGGLLAITGTLGDLFESMFKRQSGIKDSGNILPGHGGILDRFDSTFLSAPVYWLLLQLLI